MSNHEKLLMLWIIRKSCEILLKMSGSRIYLPNLPHTHTLTHTYRQRSPVWVILPDLHMWRCKNSPTANRSSWRRDVSIATIQWQQQMGLLLRRVERRRKEGGWGQTTNRAWRHGGKRRCHDDESGSWPFSPCVSLTGFVLVQVHKEAHEKVFVNGGVGGAAGMQTSVSDVIEQVTQTLI